MYHKNDIASNICCLSNSVFTAGPRTNLGMFVNNTRIIFYVDCIKTYDSNRQGDRDDYICLPEVQGMKCIPNNLKQKLSDHCSNPIIPTQTCLEYCCKLKSCSEFSILCVLTLE